MVNCLRIMAAGIGFLCSIGTAAHADESSGSEVAISSSIRLQADMDWRSVGGGFKQQHYSELSQINTSTVSRLGLAWSLDLPGEHSLEATPLAVHGVLYFSGQNSVVYAVQAATGHLLWRFDPHVGAVDKTRFRYVFSVNRGVAFDAGRIFVGTLDGRLIALSSRTGHVLWSVMTIDPSSKHTITGAPTVVANTVIIGNGGGDYGERGYVTAYDLKTGHLAWRFYTVPGPPWEKSEDPAMKMAAKTWDGKYWESGTGANVWNSITYDQELKRIYFGTGNAAPYNPVLRSPGGGDNLFTDSIVALESATGKYLWHYQVNPREAWDYDAASDVQIADLVIAGAPRRALMVAPKNGFFYVLDRDTGALLSAEKFGKATWAERIDLKSGRPVETPGIRYENGPVTLWPGPWGAHGFQATAFSPSTGLAYIDYMQVGTKYSVHAGSALGGTDMVPVLADERDGKGALIAWNPATQQKAWEGPNRLHVEWRHIGHCRRACIPRY